MKIDFKDRKLLYELDIDSRQPVSDLGRKLRLSKDAIIYRINRLKEEGMIQSFHAVIDVGKLGFISFRLYLKLQNTGLEKEREIIDYLRSRNIVTWLVSIDGEYDLGMWVLVKTVGEANELWRDLSERYRDNIAKRSLTIFTKVTYYPRSYLIDAQKNTAAFVFITPPSQGGESVVDETDIEILRLIAPDARVSIVDLARKLRLTPKTVAAKIRRLERERIIIGYRTLFDIKKLGYCYFKLHITLRLTTPEKIKAFRDRLRAHPNVTYDNEVLGGDDIELDLQVRDIEELRAIIDGLRTDFPDLIRDHKHMRFYKEHKFLFLPV